MWTIITASSVEDAEKKITKLYRDSGVSLGELLNTVEIRGLSLNDIAEVYANLCLEIDGDSVMRIEEDGTYHTLSDDSLSRKVKEEWKGILAPLVKGRNGLTPECIGRKTFGDTVDITDPGYDKDVKYRKNGVKIVPGTYECVAWRHNFPYEGRDDIRVCIAGIYLTGVDKNDVEWSPEEFTNIGVDAGLAGFFRTSRITLLMNGVTYVISLAIPTMRGYFLKASVLRPVSAMALILYMSQEMIKTKSSHWKLNSLMKVN